MSDKVSEPRRWTLVGMGCGDPDSIDGDSIPEGDSINVIETSAYDKLKADRDALREALEDMVFHTSCGACEENHKISAEALEKSKQSEGG